MGRLMDLGVKHGTDKAVRHCYLDLYERYFGHLSGQTVALLEIGYKDGKSARVWEDYFAPNSVLCSVDINKALPNVTKRTKLFRLDQSKRSDLQQMSKFAPFDIIIDDGSHVVDHQQVSLGVLFPLLKSGGIYIIEDLFLALTDAANRNPSGTQKTTSYALKSLRDSGDFDGPFILDDERKYVNSNCERCIIENGRKSEVGILVKK